MLRVILGTAHLLHSSVKQSPDGRVVEQVVSRDLCQRVLRGLREAGISASIDMPELDLPKGEQLPDLAAERVLELKRRCDIVNMACQSYGQNNILYVSLHCNAAGSDRQWHSAHGWSVFVCPNASRRSTLFANFLATSAKASELRVLQPKVSQQYWEKSLYVLRHTACPAVLVENMFMDNRNDAAFLLSDVGREVLAQVICEAVKRYRNLLFMNSASHQL